MARVRHWKRGNGGAIITSAELPCKSNYFVWNEAGEAATPYENGGYANAGLYTSSQRR